jgi:hypothetical protein
MPSGLYTALLGEDNNLAGSDEINRSTARSTGNVVTDRLFEFLDVRCIGRIDRLPTSVSSYTDHLIKMRKYGYETTGRPAEGTVIAVDATSWA